MACTINKKINKKNTLFPYANFLSIIASPHFTIFVKNSSFHKPMSVYLCIRNGKRSWVQGSMCYKQVVKHLNVCNK